MLIRSAGFRPMVRDDAARARFVAALVALCDKHGFDGVDYNWEYPGYEFGRGYLPEAELKADYDGLGALLRETRAALSLWFEWPLDEGRLALAAGLDEDAICCGISRARHTL